MFFEIGSLKDSELQLFKEKTPTQVFPVNIAKFL